jgi:hypothetical protein
VASANPLGGLLAQLEGLQGFGEEVRERLRDLAAFVEQEMRG